MEFPRSMTLRRTLATLLVTLASSLLLAAPLTHADFSISVGDGNDEATGDLSDQCDDVTDGIGGALGCERTDKIIDFTEYDGEFEGPDAAGYDDALTQTTNARDFIQTVVNFALSFLGLISVVIVIYGGVLYVLSRGDEEMVSKGKKTMGYAMLGILIVLGSFALVNTVIGATGGGNSDTLGSGAGTGTTIDEAGAAFDTDAVLDEIEDIVQDYITNQDTYNAVASEMANMLSQEVPFQIDLNVTDNSLSGYVDYINEWLAGADQSFDDTILINDSEHLRDFTNQIQNGILDIQAEVDPFSTTYERAQELYDFILSGDGAEFLSAVVSEPGNWEKFVNWLLPVAHANVDVPGFLDELIDQGVSAGSCSSGLNENTGVFHDPTEGDGGNIDGESRSGIGGIHSQSYDGDMELLDGVAETCEMMYDVYEATVDDYEENLELLVERAEDLKLLFETDVTGGSSLEFINDAAGDFGFFGLLENELNTFAAKSNAVEKGSVVTSQRLRSVIQAADDFYKLVEDIQFVETKLTASVTRGNAPLIVNFDALGSLDPSGTTVQEGQIFWDLNGDGSFADDEGRGDIGDSVSYTYEKAGTYRVRLKVVSADPNVAAGLATIAIVVEPPESQIVLTAETNSGTKTTIADFTQFPPVDSSTYKLTAAEAQAGISFDARGTLDGEGNAGPSGIIQYEWDFGDNTFESGSFATHGVITHAYGEEGSFDVSLTVTDSTGVEDRKYFKLFVASPAARISCSPSTVEVDETVKCNGAQSSADIGTIVRFDWTAEDQDGQRVNLETNSGSSVNMNFDEPGVYTVNLSVTDSSGTTDTNSTQIVVESQAPVALFDVSTPDEQRPGLRVFDASDSYDPDEADEISFEWDFDGEEGEDFEIQEGDFDSEEVTVLFLNKGDREVSLTVSDQHDEELQKSSTRTETVSVDSVLDIDLEVDGEKARFLDENGEVEVEFLASSELASFLEIDFDDGETDATQSISRGQARFSHTYTEAGVFNVTVTAEDDEGDSNSHTVRVYISPGDAPIAVIDVSGSGEDIGSGSRLTGNVNTTFVFDASESVNVDGSTNDLKYSWNFGNGTTSSQKKVTKSFDEQATYTVTLTVRDEDDSNLVSESSVLVEIEGISPDVKTLSLTPQGDSLETPVQVNLAVEAEDQDGKISYYKGWYYSVNDSATELGTVISQSPNFSITVNTNGEEGEEKEYAFAVEVTDNDNQSTILDEESHPMLTVTNGPNDNPVASFSVDRTSIFLGETLTISDTSYDPDGEITKLWIDLEGNGFFDNDPITTGSVEWTPTQVYPDGVGIRVKVQDDAGATDVSEEVNIYVDAVTEPPEAAFLADVEGTSVTFSNNSTLDGVSLQGVYWDINLSDDSNGNGEADDDIDYLEENFTHTYDDFGTYQVKFTVVDETGQSDSVTRDVDVIDAADPEADFTPFLDEEGGTMVNFKNASFVDEDNDVTVRSYSWDFDLDVDSDGDGTPDNDEDSTSRSPSHDYEAYGTYAVKLTVVDSLGKSDSVTESVDVPSPIAPLDAVLTAVPQPNSNKQVRLTGESSDVTLYYSATGGSEKYQFELDKNIFYDTEGDGIRENDVDYDAKEPGAWTTTFFESYGQTVVKLTVTDLETGETDVATLQVVFQGSLGAANLFNATPSKMMLLILSALLTAILGVSLVFRNQVRVQNRIKR